MEKKRRKWNQRQGDQIKETNERRRSYQKKRTTKILDHQWDQVVFSFLPTYPFPIQGTYVHTTREHAITMQYSLNSHVIISMTIWLDVLIYMIWYVWSFNSERVEFIFLAMYNLHHVEIKICHDRLVWLCDLICLIFNFEDCYLPCTLERVNKEMFEDAFAKYTRNVK